MTSEQHPHPRTGALLFATLGAIVCGAGVATQSRINGELARVIEDGYVAAAISFGSGLALLAVAMLLAPSGRRGLSVVRHRIASGRMPWWYVVGGAGGALFVLSQGLTAATLGIAMFTIAVVAGQTISGLFVDRSGIGATTSVITVTRIVGSLLALVAVGLVAIFQPQSGIPPWTLVLPFLGGVAMAWQQAVNGQVRVVSASPLTASFINFLVGTTILVIAAATHVAIAGPPDSFPGDPVLYLGGVVGVVFIAGAVVIAPITGVLVLGLGLIAGQSITSLLLDLVLPVAQHPITWTTVVGTVITLVAVGLAAIPAKARR